MWPKVKFVIKKKVGGVNKQFFFRWQQVFIPVCSRAFSWWLESTFAELSSNFKPQVGQSPTQTQDCRDRDLPSLSHCCTALFHKDVAYVQPETPATLFAGTESSYLPCSAHHLGNCPSRSCMVAAGSCPSPFSQALMFQVNRYL